jgi:acyl-CoA reductase-like NAD-dependent aldehyde dehydrogenase
LSDTRSGDRGITIVERAPYGIIGAITPTTNPTATIINNAICAISAGNAIIFNPHPRARSISADAVGWINEALLEVGAPADLVACIVHPSIESAQALMHHPDVRVLLVTGGPAVVAEARSTGKKAILAGPGNPPVVVDETADLERAGRGIVAGASFDNNLICTDEKEVFVVASAADALLREMVRAGAFLLKAHQLRRLERVIFQEMGPAMKPGKINPRWIGQDAAKILSQIGVQAGDELRLIVAEVPLEHSLVWTEQMLPVLPVVRVKDAETAIQLAIKAEHGFGHTASIYSRDVDRITHMARAIDVSIFVANGPNYAGLGEGGEGHTSFSIASPTGEGLTRPRTFTRERRITMVDSLRAV